MSKPKLIVKNPIVKEVKAFYVAGSLGLSEVAAAIKKEFGHIIPRSQRRKIARNNRKPFVAFTTGESYHLLPHQVGRQLQKAEAYKAKINSKVWKKGRAQ